MRFGEGDVADMEVTERGVCLCGEPGKQEFVTESSYDLTVL